MDTQRITSEIIQRAKDGDSAAISTIYQTYVGLIFRYIVYRVGAEQDAEDLTAEVFVRMVKDISRYEDKGAPFEAWLYRIAAARVADFHRRNTRRPQAELSDNLMSDRDLPETQFADQQESKSVREAVLQLTQEEQTILVMRFVERKSHKEVAATLRKSVSAVKSAQHRALQRLATLLGSEEKARHYLRGRND